MKLTNTKIKRLIRESLQRILFESEERIQQLKDQEALLFSKRIAAQNAGDNKTAQKLTQQLEDIKAEYESLEKKKARQVKEREPSEFDEMFVDIDTSKQVVPRKQKPSRRGFFSNLFGGEDTPSLEAPEEMAMFDVTPGSDDLEFQDTASQPMTAKEKQQAINRRGFLQGLGASAVIGTQIFDFYKDISYEDFINMSEAEKTKFVRAFVDSELQNMAGAIEYATKNSGAAESIIDDITDRLVHRLLKNKKHTPKADDLFDQLQDYVGDYIDELILVSKDPRLKIVFDWFDQSFADGTWATKFDPIANSEGFKSLYKDINSVSIETVSNEEFVDFLYDYLDSYLMGTDVCFNSEIINALEKNGYTEDDFDDLEEEIKVISKQKIKSYYTSDKLKQVRNSSSKTTTLSNDMIEAATEGYVDEHFNYNGATEVISNGTLEDIDLFEHNEAIRCAAEFMNAEGLNISKSDRNYVKLLNAIRDKIDKIMSRLGGP